MFGRKKQEKAAQDVTAMSFDELYAEAQERELEGRSNMSKAELVVAIADARHGDVQGPSSDGAASAPVLDSGVAAAVTDIAPPEDEDPEVAEVSPEQLPDVRLLREPSNILPLPGAECEVCGTALAWYNVVVENRSLEVVALCPDQKCDRGPGNTAERAGWER